MSASARLDQHSEFGTFVSPRVSGLVRRGPWSSRVSYGTGFFAPTPLTEETEAAGLSRLTVDRSAEGRARKERVVRRHPRERSAVGHADVVSFAPSTIRSKSSAPTATCSGIFRRRRRTRASRRSAVWKTEDFSFVANYAYVRSRETTDEGRVDVPLTPRHSVGLDAAWEWEGAGRLGVEWFYTGTQRLEANPYRTESRPYSVFGVLATRRIGRVAALHQRREPDRRQADAVGAARAAGARRRRPVDRRCVGAARRPQHQRRRADFILNRVRRACA